MPFQENSPTNRTRRSLFSIPSGHRRLCVVTIQALKAAFTSTSPQSTGQRHSCILQSPWAGLRVLPSHHPAGNWPTKTQLSGGTGTSSILFPAVTPNRKACRNGLRWKERNSLPVTHLTQQLHRLPTPQHANTPTHLCAPPKSSSEEGCDLPRSLSSMTSSYVLPQVME